MDKNIHLQAIKSYFDGIQNEVCMLHSTCNSTEKVVNSVKVMQKQRRNIFLFMYEEEHIWFYI